jgi:hypothetical protein
MEIMWRELQPPVKCCAELILYSMTAQTHRYRNPTRQVTTGAIATSASADTAKRSGTVK